MARDYDDDDITPAGAMVAGFRWLPVVLVFGVVAVLLVTGLSLFVFHVGGVFQKAGIQRTYTNTVNSQAYQQSLLAEMSQHVTNISGPGGLAATRASLPASSPEQQVLRAQELNELTQLCAESVNFNPAIAPGAQQMETVVTANCLAGSPVASPQLAPAS